MLVKEYFGKIGFYSVCINIIWIIWDIWFEKILNSWIFGGIFDFFLFCVNCVSLLNRDICMCRNRIDFLNDFVFIKLIYYYFII